MHNNPDHVLFKKWHLSEFIDGHVDLIQSYCSLYFSLVIIFMKVFFYSVNFLLVYLLLVLFSLVSE